MRDEGIFDGDLIGVHRTADARSGQIVIARIDEEMTVKLLKVGKDRISLLPRNPDYAPIDVMPAQDFAIEGLYCGPVRPNRGVGVFRPRPAQSPHVHAGCTPSSDERRDGKEWVSAC